MASFRSILVIGSAGGQNGTIPRGMTSGVRLIKHSLRMNKINKDYVSNLSSSWINPKKSKQNMYFSKEKQEFFQFNRNHQQIKKELFKKFEKQQKEVFQIFHQIYLEKSKIIIIAGFIKELLVLKIEWKISNQ